MKSFSTKYVLPIALVLAIIVAFMMKTTVFRQPTGSDAPMTEPSVPFRQYWFSGKAELNRYSLEQAQYGALNPGEAVLIFVTEDFRTDTHVKAESPESRNNAVPVLKTNLIKRFTTGIYDYALFTSVFTPIHNPTYPNTLKVSTSGQEWCGHSYVQIDEDGSKYTVDGQSYFEKEAHEAYSVEKVLLEDELWNRIRLDPAKLPTGSIRLIPSTMSARLRHKRLDPLDAIAKLDAYEGVLFPGLNLKAYRLEYPADNRNLMIVFEGVFPYKIVGWSETYKSKDNLLTSRAVLKTTIQSDYWNHNTPADSVLRDTLMH
jgi:hypothetical protein